MQQNIEIDRLALTIGRLVINSEMMAQQIEALKKENDELKAKQDGE